MHFFSLYQYALNLNLFLHWIYLLGQVQVRIWLLVETTLIFMESKHLVQFFFLTGTMWQFYVWIVWMRWFSTANCVASVMGFCIKKLVLWILEVIGFSLPTLFPDRVVLLLRRIITHVQWILRVVTWIATWIGPQFRRNKFANKIRRIEPHF